jgi:hypothetical protein
MFRSYYHLQAEIYTSEINEDHTNIDDTLKEFNSIHSNIQYTIEKEKKQTELFRYNHK